MMRRFTKFPVKESPDDLYMEVIINVDNIISIEPYDETFSIIKLPGFNYFVEGDIEEVRKLLLEDLD